MITRYPRIRYHDERGRLVLREGLFLCFFLRHPHAAISRSITRALDIYLEAVGVEALGWYLDSREEADPEEDKSTNATLRPLDGHGWSRVRSWLHDPSSCILRLQEHQNSVGGFHFEYQGRQSELLESPAWKDAVSALSFWLPTEYLEEQGPERVRALAVALARELPFTSGYLSLAFNALTRFDGVVQTVHAQCFHHPGMDIHDLSETSLEIGTRVRGPYWLNFYGQPLLGQLGEEVLRKQLALPHVSIEELGDEKLLVSLGEQPESSEEGPHDWSPYRALARMLGPFMFEESPGWFDFSPDQLRRWHRRFLD